MLRLTLLCAGLALLLPAAARAQFPTEARVSSVQVNLLATNPPQVTATVIGSLPNPCYAFEAPQQTIQGSTITIRLTAQPTIGRGMVCAQVIRRFEHTIPIDVTGLAAGDYIVVVNGARAPLRLGEGGALPAAPAPGSPECPAETPDQRAFRDPAAGFCLLYPSNFALAQPPSGLTVITLRGEAAIRPAVTLAVEAANGRALDDIAAEQRAAHPDAEMTFISASLAGHPALITDDVPGSLGTRQAFIVAYDRLYTLVAVPVDAAQPLATQTAEALWQAVTTSLVILPPAAAAAPAGTERRFDDLGIAITLPDGWLVEQRPGLYGLVSPNALLMVQVGGIEFPITFGALDDLPTGSLDTLAREGIRRFEAQGESRLFAEPMLSPDGEPIGMAVYGFKRACAVYLIPNGARVTTITLTPLACDLDNRIKDEQAAAIIRSVRRLGE